MDLHTLNLINRNGGIIPKELKGKIKADAKPEEGAKPNPKGTKIPDDWQELGWREQVVLALKISGKPKLTADEARAILKKEMDRREKAATSKKADAGKDDNDTGNNDGQDGDTNDANASNGEGEGSGGEGGGSDTTDTETANADQ